MKSYLIITLLLVFGLNAKADITPVAGTVESSLPPIHVGQQVYIGQYRFNFAPEEYHPLKADIGDLTEKELELFKSRRRMIISQVARILSFRKTKSGIGMVEGNKMSMAHDGVLNTNPIEALAVAESKAANETLNENQKINRTHKLLLKIMTQVDNFMFQNARTAVGSNEFGLDLALSVGSVVGGRGKYIIGGAVGIQLVFGFNMQTKQVIFQVKLFSEKATHGITGIFMPIGITPRIGGYMKASAKAPTTYDITYVPAAPVYLTRSNGMAGIGATASVTGLGLISAGLLTVVEAAMAYKSETTTLTILDTETIRLKVKAFKDMVNLLKHSTTRRPAGASCQRLFV